MEINETLQLILSKLDGLGQDVSGLKQDVSGLKQEVNKINIKLENVIEPKLQLIYENQKNIIESDVRLTSIENNIERNADDIVVLNMAVKKHTSDIELLKAN